MNSLAARTAPLALTFLACMPALSAQGVLAHWPGPQYDGPGDVAAAGDINGDSVCDLAYTQPDLLPAGIGHLIVRSGVDLSVLLDVAGLAPGDGFGSLVEALGDVDGDGRGDLVVVATAYVACISGANGAVLWQIPQANVVSLTGLADLDLDGARDWALGAVNTLLAAPGLVRIHSGRTGAALSTIAPPPNASRYFGFCVASAGDFDLDGNPDLLVGDPSGGNGNGSVSVHGISQPGVAGYFQGPQNPYGHFSWWFGASVATPGDVDGDAVPDLLVGSPGETFGPGNGYEGGPSGRARMISGASGLTLFDFTQFVNGNGFGFLVDTYPDLDGDGRPELLISAGIERIGCCHYFPGELRIHSSLTGALRYHGQRQGAQRVAAVRDLSGDGIPELLMAQTGPATTSLVLPFVSHYQGIPGCVPKVNSKGCIAWLDASGFSSLSMGDDLRLSTYGLIHASVGLFLFSQQSATLPFGGGTLCVGGAIRRSAQFNAGGTTDCAGAFALDIPKSTLAQLGGGVGSVLYVQAWYRDSGFAPPNNIGLSTGLAFTLFP
ncbi:MAG TPA: FG-GAP repeat protein [Planctomycetota bacterium]|nr:FG-GAP repeat protein [Planctomycetota bacterium]